MDAIAEFGFDACIGGARRDEEKARAKERIFSFRNSFGQWDPRHQRPELWSLYNGRLDRGEHMRVFPLSNWTELDVWQYVARERLELPPLYYAHARSVAVRGNTLLPVSDLVPLREDDAIETRMVRFRTVGDISCTSPVDFDRRDRRGDSRRNTQCRAQRARRDAARRPGIGCRDGRAQTGRLFLMAPDYRESLRGDGDAGLLRFSTAGSVDDGKSSLIGRMLYDAQAVPRDRLEALERLAKRRGETPSIYRC